MPNATHGGKFQKSRQLRAVEKCIRRIVRAHDLQSKALVKTSGVTSAQLTLLRGAAELGEVTSVALSAYADISPATVVTVLDNLEERGLIERYRSGSDRRIVHVRLTPAGAAVLAGAPDLLGPGFIARFIDLEPGEQAKLVDGLVLLADMLARETLVPPRGA